MKTKLNLFLSTLMLSSGLVGCGHQLQPSAPHQMAPQATIQAPLRAQNFSTQYWLGTVLSSEYRPDQNGMQFGFDYVTIVFENNMDRNNKQSLTLAYSIHQGSGRFVSIDHFTHVGTPEQQREPLNQKDTEKFKELNFFLATLATANAEDKANLQRILNKFGEIIGQDPLHPQQSGGLQTARNF